MGMVQAERNALGNHYLRGASSPRADTYYMGLTVGGTEVTTSAWTNYARVAVDVSSGGTIFGSPDNPSGTRSRWRNGSTFTFQATAAVTGTGPTVDGFALYSASTGGDVKITGTLSSAQTINDGAPVTFPSNAISVVIDETSV
jgi:hypothetical protein